MLLIGCMVMAFVQPLDCASSSQREMQTDMVDIVSNPVSDGTIVLGDSSMNEWVGLDPVIVDPSGDGAYIDYYNLTLAHDSTYCYLLLHSLFSGSASEAFTLYADTDENSETGQLIMKSGGGTLGADFKLQMWDGVFSWNGTEWLLVGEPEWYGFGREKEQYVEVGFPFQLLGAPQLMDLYLVDEWYHDDYAPNQGTSLYSLASVIIVPDDHLTIQEAINAANEGDTIVVRNGTYFEHVVVNKSLSIVGEGEDITFIDGGGSGTVIEVLHTSNTSLRDFTVRNGKIGLAITEVLHTRMRSITMIGSQYNFRFIEASEPVRSYPDIDTSNTAEGAPIYFWMNQHNRTIADDAGFVALRNCSGITLRNLNLSNNGNGIYAVVVSGLLVENVTTSNTIQGLSLYAVTDSVIRNSVIEHNMLGIGLARCDRNVIIDNLISSNDCVIILEQSRYNTVEKNQIAWSNQNWLSAGLRLSYTSYNTIKENMIANNERGIVYTESYNNSIFHNNFEMNNMQISDQGVVHYPNFWDNGCEGNFWSNYNGTDLNDDGIGDTDLPWEGVDHYPLVNLYWKPGDIDHDLDIDIFDVVKCGIAYGSTPSDPNWNPHCDINEPYRIIDIFDVVIIGINYGEEYAP
jgi:nitrous oxidase accessory protein